MTSIISPNIRELPLICLDAGNSSWRYNKDDDSYYRLYPNNDYVMIKRKHMPDAQKLWDNRISRLGNPNANSIALSKPSEATFKLSEHALAIEKNMLYASVKDSPTNF